MHNTTLALWCLFLAADIDIDTLPRRQTDNARVLDTSKNTVKLYTTDGGTKLLRRQDGRVERQHRLNIGTLPVAYTSDGADNLLYIMDRAVTCYSQTGKLDSMAAMEQQYMAVCQPRQRSKCENCRSSACWGSPSCCCLCHA